VILLVGGTGFLGSFVAARLAERHPAVFARLSSDISVLPAGLELRRGDLNTGLPLHGISTLIYCASMGFGHIPRVIEQLQHSDVKRAVFVSTTAIFTSLPSRSRALRLEAEAAVERSQLEWTILRPTMIYGTSRDRNISRLLRFLKRSPVFPLCGDALWQPIYVEDLADAVVAALDSSVTQRKMYNVAGAEPLRFSELVKTAARAMNRHVRLIPVPLEVVVLAARITRIVTAEQIRRLAEDKAFSYADAARDFNFAPRSFAAGVQREAAMLVP
jgi:nucleoside-diphosphate-sugar epimerase